MLREFKFIIDIDNLSQFILPIPIKSIIPSLFDKIKEEFLSILNNRTKVSNPDVINKIILELNGLLFVLYLFYPNELEDNLIRYKYFFIKNYPQRIHIDIRTQLNQKIPPKNIPIFINYFQYLFNFIEQILLNTENIIIDMQKTDLIFNVTSNLYQRQQIILGIVEEEGDSSGGVDSSRGVGNKGGKKIRSIKHKISKKIHKTKNNKKQTSKKSRKQKLIKKNIKTKRNNH